MSSSTQPPVHKLLVLGGEGAGKSTLVEQLRALAAGGCLHDGPTLQVAPTTGQEMDTLTFPASVVRAVSHGVAASPSASLSGSFEPSTSARPGAAKQRRNVHGEQRHGDDPRYLPGAIIDDDVDDDDDARPLQPSPPPPAMAHPPSPSHREPTNRHIGGTASAWGTATDMVVSIKEFGGAMAPVWPRLMAGSDCGKALIYVLDASNPTMLPTAAIELLELFASEQAGCLEWKVLVVINKVCMPAAMHPNDVAALCCLPQLQQAHPAADIAVVAVDTWSGEGLDFVLRWVLAIGNPGAASKTVSAAAPYAV